MKVATIIVPISIPFLQERRKEGGRGGSPQAHGEWRSEVRRHLEPPARASSPYHSPQTTRGNPPTPSREAPLLPPVPRALHWQFHESWRGYSEAWFLHRRGLWAPGRQEACMDNKRQNETPAELTRLSNLPDVTELILGGAGIRPQSAWP